jgi:hypothetical protein
MLRSNDCLLKASIRVIQQHGSWVPASLPISPYFFRTTKGTNWTLVVNTDGSVMERDLGNHEPGTLLAPSVKIVSSSVKDGARTIVMTRSIAGTAADDMKFDVSANSMPFINAVGINEYFMQGHAVKATGVMYFVETDYPTCLCDVASDQGTLGGVRVVRKRFALEDAIVSHA